jgi:hypothetical protein
MRDRSSIANPGYVGLEGMPRDNSDIEFLGILVPQLCIEARSIADIDALLGPNGAEGPVEGADLSSSRWDCKNVRLIKAYGLVAHRQGRADI